MRSEGQTARGGAAGGDVKVSGHTVVFRGQRRPTPPSPTRIRDLTPEQEAEQEAARKKVTGARKKIAQNHDYDRRSRQPSTLPQEKIDRIIELYTAGHSAGAVAAAVGTSKTTTLRYLREGDIPIRGSRKRGVSTEEMSRAYARGMSLREIGQLYGLSNTTVRSRLIEAGVEIRSKGAWREMRRQGAVGGLGEGD